MAFNSINSRSLTKQKMQKLVFETLTVYSGHPVLDQLAQDLVAGLKASDIPSQKITVYVGIHRRFGFHLLRSNIKIAIQTEHFFDADGRKMWRKTKRLRTLINTLFCHYVLDLSLHNKTYYEFLPQFLRRRIIFGPGIFPSSQPEFQPGKEPTFLFFGEMNDRRKKLILLEPPDKIKVLSTPTFGINLTNIMGSAAGILNLHYVDGRYSEMPRLLTACLAGKVVMSEALGGEIRENRDYVKLGNYPNEKDARIIYNNFWENFAQHNSFADFLKEVVNK